MFANIFIILVIKVCKLPYLGKVGKKSLVQKAKQELCKKIFLVLFSNQKNNAIFPTLRSFKIIAYFDVLCVSSIK